MKSGKAVACQRRLEIILEGCEILEGGNAFMRVRENICLVLKEVHRGKNSSKGIQVVLTNSLASCNLL